MIEGDQVMVTVRVEVEPAVAFEVFTNEIDLWWRGGIAYRVAGRRPGTLVMERKVGGRLFEQYEGPDGPRMHQAARSRSGNRPATSRSNGAVRTSSPARSRSST